MVAQTPTSFLHTIELADRWKISPRTLERWRWLGTGPAYVRVGGRVIYRLDVIEAYERSCEIESVR